VTRRFHSIAVVGAGAVGSFYGAMLAPVEAGCGAA
jgi:ketopantoate reductase